jgi:hypothetical protein
VIDERSCAHARTAPASLLLRSISTRVRTAARSLTYTIDAPVEYVIGTDKSLVLHSKFPFDKSTWVPSVASSPSNASRTFNGFVEVLNMFVGVGQSDDGPVAIATPKHPNVFALLANGPPANCVLTAVSSDYDAPDPMYNLFAVGSNGSAGVVLLWDSGRTWTTVLTLRNTTFTSVLVPRNYNTAVIVGGASLHISMDYGVTWDQPATPPPTLSSTNYVTSMAVLGSQLVLVTSGGEIYRSVDNGQEWELVEVYV